MGINHVLHRKSKAWEVVPQELRILSKMAVPLTPETEGGGMSKVYEIVRERVHQALNLREGDFEIENLPEKVDLLCRGIEKKARRNEFRQKLFAKGKLVDVPKDRMAMAFGPHGNRVASLPEKILFEDGPEAARTVALFGIGRKMGLDVLKVIREIRNEFVTVQDCETGLFVDVNGVQKSVLDFLEEDEWIKVMIKNMKQTGDLSDEQIRDNVVRTDHDLEIFQRALRVRPLNDAMNGELLRYFSQSKQYGIRTTLRRFSDDISRAKKRGSIVKNYVFSKFGAEEQVTFSETTAKVSNLPRRAGHPQCGWPKAQEIIRAAFEEYGGTDFVLAETNMYRVDIDLPDQEIERILDQNDTVVSEMSHRFIGRLPERLKHRFGNEMKGLMWRKILEHHHDFPVIKKADSSSLFSLSGARLMKDLTRHLWEWFRGMPYSWPPNQDYDQIVRGFVSDGDFDTVLKLVSDLMLEYQKNDGIDTDDEKMRFENLPYVNYTFQQRFGVVKEGEKEVANLSLIDLRDSDNWHYFQEFPDLSKKLLVFFVLAYRLYNETGYLLDLRPDDDVFRKMLLFGVYGFETDNVRVLLKINKFGQPETVIKLLDNKDQFKRWIKEKEGAAGPGLAKTGLGLAPLLAKPALLRAIGKCVGNIWEAEQE